MSVTGPLATTIRRATQRDAITLARFAEDCFRDTFGSANRPEDMDQYVAAVFGAEQQCAEISDPRAIVLLMESDSKLVGYAQLLRDSVAETVARIGTSNEVIELQRFYVAREWHGRGLAQLLMRAAIDAASECGVDTVWLAVWEHNPRAIRFYERQGFSDRGSRVFVLGDDRQTDRVMSRPVRR